MLSLTRRSRSPRLAGPISDTRQRLPQLRCGASHAYRPSRNPARDLSDRAWRTRSPSPTQARTPLGPFLYISSVRSLAKTHQRASKRAGASGARCSDHPTVSDHQPSRNVSGTAVRNRNVNRDHPRTIDHPAIDHRERLWDRGGQIATRPFAIFPQKNWKRTRVPDIPPCFAGHLLREGEIGAGARSRLCRSDASRCITLNCGGDHPDARPSTIATSLGPRCAIATRHRGKFPRKKLRLAHKSASRVRFLSNRTLSQHRPMPGPDLS